MGIDARAKRIELAVSANTAPGFMRWSRLEGVASRGGTTITNIVGKGWKDPPGEVMLVRTANTSDCFRGLVSLLTADDAECGIPAEVIEEVRVFGLVRDGVLSQHAVLPWEDGEEYRSLSRFQSPFPRSLVNAPCRCALIQINRRSTDGTSRPPKIW